MRRDVVIKLGVFANEALSGEKWQAERVPERLVSAMRVYLHDKDPNRPGWRYPEFAHEDVSGQQVELVVSLDQELWNAFAAEAAGQGVSFEQLVEHAALYFAAEIDSGRITKRILDQMDDA